MKSRKSFLCMLQSVDAFFPTGAFTLSNGLEDYVLQERITSGLELEAYLHGFLQIFPYNDLGLLSLAYRKADHPKELLKLDHLAAAMKSAREIRTGSVRMNSRYLKARTAMNDCDGMLRWYQTQIQEQNAVGFHPIALGIYAAQTGLDENELLEMYAYSVLSSVVNNAVKLVPLSQMEGQRILFEQLDALENVVLHAMRIGVEELGVSGCAYDIHCMNHEHLYSRQYMS